MSAEVTPDHPVGSDFVGQLKGAMATGDRRKADALLRATAATGGNPDATIELSNDDWLKDPSVQLPPAVLMGEFPRRSLAMAIFLTNRSIPPSLRG
ncbi:ankyrin repeat and SOCS box protein 18-like [Anguilla anguilla]|uniref:ankyrin repeat and SOCS box protein 18-like n=1 Tax=Anguilla anguilla TaxID=7936 RepID=UPI0015A819E9|nr:ankyrin repeat and SOCS box protein 18-like [Anguilla anguilla]